jgi:hypothetical protein
MLFPPFLEKAESFRQLPGRRVQKGKLTKNRQKRPAQISSRVIERAARMRTWSLSGSGKNRPEAQDLAIWTKLRPPTPFWRQQLLYSELPIASATNRPAQVCTSFLQSGQVMKLVEVVRNPCFRRNGKKHDGFLLKSTSSYPHQEGIDGSCSTVFSRDSDGSL